MLEQDGSQQVPFPHGHSNVTGLLMYRVPWTTPQLVLAKSPPVNQDIFLFAQTCVKTALGGKKGCWHMNKKSTNYTHFCICLSYSVVNFESKKHDFIFVSPVVHSEQ